MATAASEMSGSRPDSDLSTSSLDDPSTADDPETSTSEGGLSAGEVDMTHFLALLGGGCAVKHEREFPYIMVGWTHASELNDRNDETVAASRYFIRMEMMQWHEQNKKIMKRCED